MMKQIKPICILACVCCLAYSAAIAQNTGTFTDPRDGHTYKTITKNYEGKQYTWFAENLNYKMEGSYAYDNDEKYRATYGLLYVYAAAMVACPNGWHLSSDVEWDILVKVFGGENEAGQALKSNTGWKYNGNGNNSSGFNALPAGFHHPDGSFSLMGNSSFWWSSSPAGNGKAWIWNTNFDNSTVYRYDHDVSDGYSVRCVRD
jgi:uncharacterized protein (TIGR02145 family)